MTFTQLETATDEGGPLADSVATNTNSVGIRSIAPTPDGNLTPLEDSVQPFQVCYLHGAFQQVFSRDQPRLESGEQGILDRTM